MTAQMLNDLVLDRLREQGINPDDPDQSIPILAACYRVARKSGYTMVGTRHLERDGTSDCDQVERYVNGGHTVNLWIVDVQGVGFHDGGLGFDECVLDHDEEIPT